MRHLTFALLLLLPLAAGSTPAAPPETPIVLHAARVLDGRGRALTDATVTVRGSQIVSVEPGSKAPATYELGGLTLMPGGIDTHVHISWHFDPDGKTHHDEKEPPAQTMLYAVENAVETLRGGITTVQSLGAPEDKDLRDWIAHGIIHGQFLFGAISRQRFIHLDFIGLVIFGIVQTLFLFPPPPQPHQH